MGFTLATKSDRFFRHISPLPVGFHPSHKGRSLFPSYLSLLGETRATKGDRFFRHISPCWVKPKQQMLGFTRATKGDRLFE
ncbi:hypothetical protein [Limnospira indica]|uniref:hypothetical protein n=1 Tax=Limnospira indica TaxID=147322 RepID=UPI0012FEC02F|nr:hypothetical protein [Limnospira indica]